MKPTKVSKMLKKLLNDFTLANSDNIYMQNRIKDIITELDKVEKHPFDKVFSDLYSYVNKKYTDRNLINKIRDIHFAYDFKKSTIEVMQEKIDKLKK